jgi:DNA-binding transcriptional ArsR family regulator
MIRLRLNSADLQRMRFAYSPLTETAESLYMLHSGRITAPHRSWFDNARSAIQRFDNDVLRAAVPVCGDLAHVFLVGATDATTSIDEQLALVAAYPPEHLKADLEVVWQGRELPPAAQRLVADGAAGARRLADAVGAYWEAAIEPHWRQIRMLLDADVAYRASQLARGGISAMMSDLHPAISVGEGAFEIRARAQVEHDLAGAGILLIPSVYVWPYINIDLGQPEETSLTYAARGVGTLWEPAAARAAADDPLAALLGRTRATILETLAVAQSTTDLARRLRQSASTISSHLAILRRCGMVTCWPSGRRVLYERTPLASSLLIASGNAPQLGSVYTA